MLIDRFTAQFSSAKKRAIASISYPKNSHPKIDARSVLWRSHSRVKSNQGDRPRA
ncbi:hypothetical protein IQ270_05410 [Microcoleus sp. LEGE 07076]|uniref:hypothetical protein n=1 Tax=Microcoleus sp. LEGE 07076 TaxID=915322 RepID=UPI001880E056|nr:hypothetical protein [Microcoleus sp. LEGE 07076]MBE9184172.1 hypothetical protein [Microcoleus sp. LEGE 07076]